MTTPTPLDVLTQYFGALESGDFDTVRRLFADDIVWHQPGANRFSGRYQGAEAVFGLLGGMTKISQGTLRVVADGPAMVNGDLVAAPVRFQASRDGAQMDMRGIDLLTVTDGKIVRVDLFSEDGPAEDAFWGAS